MAQKPVMLLILDGWGYRKEITSDNAIEQGNTPNWHNLLKSYPNSLIETSGLEVGLPDGQMGNSEVGHTNIGAGRIVMQELPKVLQAVKKGDFENEKPIQDLIKTLKNSGKACHLMGLMSDGGVHSHIEYILGISKILDKHGIKTYIHALTDGRDTPPNSAIDFISEFEKEIAPLKNVKIAVVSGRFYAMDRDKRWDRVEKAFKSIVLGEGTKFATSIDGIKASYANDVNDEFIIPFVVDGYQGIEDGDALLSANFRADRMREINYALCDEGFNDFPRSKFPKFSKVISMTEYSSDHNRFMDVVYGPESLKNIYGEVIANHGLKQLRIAETEKYAHVTFFFNGGEEELFEGEERILVPSPKVTTYDLKPEMSVYEITDKLVAAIEAKKFDTIICNFANGDMVGHTGIMEAALKAVAAVDECLGRVVEAIKKVDGTLIVTADHGNCEKMIDEKTGGPYTAHTVGKVQAILVNDKSGVKSLKDGKLADLAPTMLELLGIKQPIEMTGISLIEK